MRASQFCRSKANMDALGEAIRLCRGIVLIVGHSKTRNMRAASVLLNDAATAHPDGLFLATHGYLATSSICNVRPLNRSSFTHDDAFKEMISTLQPDGFSMHVRDSNDMQLMQVFAAGAEMFVVGITQAKTSDELTDLTARIWMDSVIVTAK